MFWKQIKAMRQNSRPLYNTQKEAEIIKPLAETAKPAESKLFEPIPDKEIGEEQKAVKKAKKRKETAVNDVDNTTD